MKGVVVNQIVQRTMGFEDVRRCLVGRKHAVGSVIPQGVVNVRLHPGGHYAAQGQDVGQWIDEAGCRQGRSSCVGAGERSLHFFAKGLADFREHTTGNRYQQRHVVHGGGAARVNIHYCHSRLGIAK